MGNDAAVNTHVRRSIALRITSKPQSELFTLGYCQIYFGVKNVVF